jgi:hypothetical protein
VDLLVSLVPGRHFVRVYQKLCCSYRRRPIKYVYGCVRLRPRVRPRFSKQEHVEHVEQVDTTTNDSSKRRGTCSHDTSHNILSFHNFKSIHDVFQDEDEDAAVRRPHRRKPATPRIISKGSRSSYSWTSLPVRYLCLCRAKDGGVSVDTRRLHLSCLG